MPSMSVTHAVPVRGDRGSGRRRGLTLLESLMAIAVLVVVVTAVMSAMSAGRAQSEQARRSISAALAAEMLMSRVTGIDPDVFQSQDAWYAHFTDPATAGGWHGHHEVAGAIRAGRAAALPLLPAGYQDVVLRVATDRQMQMVPPPLAIAIAGVEVTVEALDDHNQTLTRLIRFVPLPRSLADAAP